MQNLPGYTVPTTRLNETLAYINELRRRGAATEAETIASQLFGANERLAVYGSLIPGKENHHIVEPISGVWSTGYVQGDFYDRGWGAGIGYPAVSWRAGGPSVPVYILTASGLSEHWSRLDDFEGSDYRRILVPVFSDTGTLIVCNLYELRR